MIYKSFAVVTLVAAPLIVLTVQSFVPQTGSDAPPVSLSPAPESAAPAFSPAPAAPVNIPPADAASFGQPMSDAGKPFLTQGSGLPDANPAPSAPRPAEPDLNEVAR